MVGWHHWLNGHEFGWTLGVSDGQGGLVFCGSWGHKESDMTEWTELNWNFYLPSGVHQSAAQGLRQRPCWSCQEGWLGKAGATVGGCWGAEGSLASRLWLSSSDHSAALMAHCQPSYGPSLSSPPAPRCYCPGLVARLPWGECIALCRLPPHHARNSGTRSLSCSCLCSDLSNAPSWTLHIGRR